MRSFLEAMIFLSKVVFNNFQCDMAVRIRAHDDLTQDAAKSEDTVKQTLGS
jgi:hypothetical protein